MKTIPGPWLFSLLVITTLFFAMAEAEELNATIDSVAEDTVLLQVEGGLVPSIGDPVTIFRVIPGVGLAATAAEGKVEAVGNRGIRVRITSQTSTISTDYRARITSDNPGKASASSGSPASKPAARDEPPPPAASLVDGKIALREGNRPGESITVAGIEMAWCPPGSFLMGSATGEDLFGDPYELHHPVTLTEGFWLARTETTQGQWKSLMGTGLEHQKTKGNTSGTGAGVGASHPMYFVSWEDCMGWIDRMNREHPLSGGWKWSLPTEAQWEYACRAGTQTVFSHGDSLGGTHANFNAEIPYGGAPKGSYFEGTKEVRSYQPNRWGLFDMHGNVYEWCADWYDGKYYALGQRDPQGPPVGSRRVARGGAWGVIGRLCRSASRHLESPNQRYGRLGFRVAATRVPPEVLPLISSNFRGTQPGEGRHNTLGMRLRWCPPGEFRMGSPDHEEGREPNERLHTVRLKRGFWMGQHEVTQEEWRKVMGRTPVDQAALMLKQTGGNVADAEKMVAMKAEAVPIYYVNWEESVQFCRKLTERERRGGTLPEGAGYRLPTEAEWEYACRAGTSTATYAGVPAIRGERDSPELDSIAWYGGNSSRGYRGPRGWNTDLWKEKQYPGGPAAPRRVGQKNPNPWGLRDMIGNLHEWCMDWDGNYPSSGTTDPSGPNRGRQRVNRGGNWGSEVSYCRAARRTSDPPLHRSVYLGFRVVLVSPR